MAMEESDIIVVVSALLESGIGARPVICHSAAWAAIYLYFPHCSPLLTFSLHLSSSSAFLRSLFFLPSQLWSSSISASSLFILCLIYFRQSVSLTIVSIPFHPVSNPELQHTGYSPYPVMFAYLQSTLIFCCCCCCRCCCCCSDRATISIPYILTGMHYVYARMQNLTAFWKYSYPPLLTLPRSTHSLLLVFRGALPHLLVLSRQIRIFPPRYTTFVTSLIHFPSNQMNSSPICFATHVTSVFSIGSSSVHTSHILPLLQ